VRETSPSHGMSRMGRENNSYRVIEKRYIYGLKVTDQIWRDVFLSLKAFWVWTRNLDRIIDKNVCDKQVNLELLLNY